MLSKAKGLSANKLVRNIIIVASGSAGAQFINFLATPFITRLFTPEAFGVFGAFISIVYILDPISAFCLPPAIILPKSDSEAKQVADLVFKYSIILSMLCMAVIYFGKELILNVSTLAFSYHLLYLLPVIVFTTGLYRLSNQWLIRCGKYKYPSLILVIQAIIVSILKVSVGLLNPTYIYLILVASFGYFLQCVLIFYCAVKAGLRQWISLGSGFISFRLIKKYKDFPLYVTPQVFLNTLTQSIPVLILMTYFGPVYAGYYTLTRSVLSVPMRLLGVAVGDVFLPKMSNALNSKEKLDNLLKKATITLASVGLGPYLLLIAFGPYLFGVVFGHDWVVAGEYARWLSLWSFSELLFIPSNKAILVISEQRFFLLYSVFSVLLKVLSLLVGVFVLKTHLSTVILYSLVSAMLNFVLISIVYCKCMD
ncbi:hypothetical protein VMF7928_02560 [Vibrio marisflavi CECT 7928]|uniref:Uncharacterized protein n=1 Tax=Vibrio marisflavi CECT 7928 TaxID=634439 RepID=A0ABN8E3S0_9VIBR|nr:hypothetical protein VMF7928_02560 [Vibrio marisflavi CECT 7928]